MKALAAAKGKAVAEVKVEDDDRWKAALTKHLSRVRQPWLYTSYKSVAGECDLPILAVENQSDHIHTNYMNNVMKREAEFIFAEVRRQDEESDPSRLCVNRQLKYQIRHDGSYGERADRKLKAQEVTAKFLGRCKAQAVLDFLMQVKRSGYPVADLCDAFLLALRVGIEFYELAAKKDDTGLKTAVEGAHVKEGSLRVHAVDPGTRHYAHCCVEIVGLQAAWLPEDETQTPVPVFRLLQWELLDLLSDSVTASLDWTTYPALPPIFEPMPNVNDVELVASLLAKQRKQRQPRKPRQPRQPRAKKDDQTVKLDNGKGLEQKKVKPTRSKKRKRPAEPDSSVKARKVSDDE